MILSVKNEPQIHKGLTQFEIAHHCIAIHVGQDALH